MAGTSMKDIRRRILSVQSTMQITKAMQLVASSKLRKARERMEDSQPYLKIAQDVIEDVAAHDTGCQSDYLAGRKIKTRCIVAIAGDRGLAGSYNANVLKCIHESADENTCYLPIGRKAVEHFANAENANLLPLSIQKADGVTVEDCRNIAQELVKRFDAGEIDCIDLAYTHFVSVLTQQARIQRLLPVRVAQTPEKPVRQMLFEPSCEELLRCAIPDYIAGMIYAAVCDSVASEQAARRVAMDSANRNASEMIDQLNLRYNRARQASITQELTEIVAGSGGNAFD